MYIQLCMLTLLELERLAVNIFLVEKEDEVLLVSIMVNSNTIGATIVFMYDKYIHDFNSRDDWRLHPNGFVIIGT